MAELSKLEKMGSDCNLMSTKEVLENQMNGLEKQSFGESDSFVVDMERFSHLIEKDIKANSRLNRNLSRKGVGKGGDKFFNQVNLNETTSPRANLHGGNSTLEKTTVVTSGSMEQPQVHHHHQITIQNSGRTPTATESKLVSKRFSFKHSSQSSWGINPRRILLFFATLSSLGTILLIYFTLSMSKTTDGSSTDS